MKVGIFGVLAGHWVVSAKNLGHDVVWSYEWHADKRLKKMSMYMKANHREVPLYGTEKALFAKHDNMPEEMAVDMIIGSPPCIGISTGNPDSNADHGANQGMIAFARAVQKFKPKIFIMEMVSNFKTAAKFKPLLAQFTELISNGYNMISPVLNLENFHSPTKRKRVFFIGFREDFNKEPERPEEDFWGTSEVWKDARTLFEEAGLPNPTEDEAVAQKLTHKWNPDWKGPFSCLAKYGINYFILPDGKPGKTMTAVGGVYIRHPDGHRAVTKQEAKVLIGFDKDYHISTGFSGTIRACAWGVPIKSLDMIMRQVVEDFNG